MNKQNSTTKSKNTILNNFLPRATSSISFQNPPIYSPSKSHKSHIGIGFSGPLVSTFSGDNTRRRIKNHSDPTTLLYEPTSPRVSCMGQVKCKYTKQKQKQKQKQKLAQIPLARDIDDGDHVHASKTESYKSKKKLGFKKLLFGGKKPDVEKSKSKSKPKPKPKVPMYLDKVPSLGTMKRFASGREKVLGIDSGDLSRDFDDENDVIVPSSAPVMMRNINQVGFDDKFARVVTGNMEPRKEINLWKRRTMAQPKPLVLHNI